MLEAVVYVSLALAVACALCGLIAFFRESDVEKSLKAAAQEVNAAAQAVAQATHGVTPLASEVPPQAAFSGPSEYLKALAAFSEALAKLKRDAAAFVLALAFLLVATVAAGIEDKVKDRPVAPTATQEPGTTR